MKAITVLALFLGFVAPGVLAKKWKNGVADPTCYRDDISWENATSIEVQLGVPDAQECQKFCQGVPSCTHWTWTDESNQEFQEWCVLFGSVGEEISYQNCVSGPRSCVCSENFACTATIDNEISVYQNVALEETCQDYCYNTSGCEFYTWYDSTEVPKNLCVLLTSCDQTFQGCSGCFSGPPSCDNPQPDELAILVTGGYGGETSAEVLFTNGSSICELPAMSQSKSVHTQSGLTACGGAFSGTSCIKFEAGSWKTLTDNLVVERSYHSSYMTPYGNIRLIGGEYSPSSTEIVFQNGTSIRSFDLKYDKLEACSIELPEMFILAGGSYTLRTVSRYSEYGWMEDLPKLNEGRYWHGCGYFYNDDMQRVFLVAGGYSSISSTETLVEGGQAWNFQQPLPSLRRGLRGISLPNTVIMTGGYDNFRSDDVLA